MLRSALFATTAIVIALAAADARANGLFIGLGDLPGGSFNSQATAVSADGSVVVGAATSAAAIEAFRWTQATGMVVLGDLPGGSSASQAKGVSADGLVVVGFGASALGPEAFRWTQAGGMVGLGDLPDGFFNSEAHAVSADGSVVVGWGTTTSGHEAFIWDESNGMRNLQEVLAAEDGLGDALVDWILRVCPGRS